MNFTTENTMKEIVAEFNRISVIVGKEEVEVSKLSKLGKTKVLVKLEEMMKDIQVERVEIDTNKFLTKVNGITRYTEELLLTVLDINKDGYNTGYTYNEILELIKEKFPTTKSSYQCVTVIAHKMKSKGLVLPVRPRKKRA